MAVQLHSWMRTTQPPPESRHHAMHGAAAEVKNAAPRGIRLGSPADAGPQGAVNRSQQLRRLGLRVTASRLGILSIFDESSEALSGEQIYALLVRRGIDSSVGTVYRSIHEFEDRGVVCREGAPGHKARYRIQREDPDEPRLRFVCSKCGRDREVLDADLYARLLAAAVEAGVPLRAQALILQGVCETRCGWRR